DPIKRLETIILEKGIATPEKLLEVKNEQVAVIDAAQKFAEESPYPDISEVYTDVYFELEGGALK
ncbi:MAG: pyruvate dehydrogenase (acetyl-transferring) E1 component subunit alpha, partial [Youngiibacter sp.]|nr:pyruvate dehydrogenase (acetyl-transferring) E1 component subunit alpha [Youngiibacter sp.]